MKKSELKALIKECLLEETEMLQEAVSNDYRAMATVYDDVEDAIDGLKQVSMDDVKLNKAVDRAEKALNAGLKALNSAMAIAK